MILPIFLQRINDSGRQLGERLGVGDAGVHAVLGHERDRRIADFVVLDVLGEAVEFVVHVLVMQVAAAAVEQGLPGAVEAASWVGVDY